MPSDLAGTDAAAPDNEQPPHRHVWIYGDQGVHWCRRGTDAGCSASLHDFPCDHPEEHDPDDVEV